MDVDGGNLGLMEVTNNFFNPAKEEHLGFLQNLYSNNPNPCNGQMLAWTRWNKKTNPQKFAGFVQIIILENPHGMPICIQK